MKRENYCFWTVAPPGEADAATRMVASAHRAGVFKEFHIWTDEHIEGAQAHPLGRFESWGGLYRFTYLRDAVVSLNFDYYVWLDPQSEFTRDPGSVLRVMRRSPFHVALTYVLSDPERNDAIWGGSSCGDIMRLMKEMGVREEMIFGAASGFFAVKRQAVARVCALAFELWQQGERRGIRLTCEPLLAYVCHMLSGDPRRHHLSHTVDLWQPKVVSGGGGLSSAGIVGGASGS